MDISNLSWILKSYIFIQILDAISFGNKTRFINHGIGLFKNVEVKIKNV
jgi:hypothetical protein